MISNFFLQDVLGGALAALLLACVLLVPGWALGEALDVCRFRARRPATRAALAVALSVAAAPAAAFLGARLTSVRATAVACAALTLAVAVAAVRRARRRGGLAAAARRVRGDALARQGTITCAAWAALALVLLADTDVGSYLYPNVVAFDYAKHISVTDAITRTGLPPVNPSFRPGHEIALYYYYFWFLVCSIADVLGGRLVSARAAVLGGTVWAGIAMVSIVALYLRFVVPPLVEGGARRMWAGAALLLVGGLDILAAPLFPGPVAFTLEWWNEQVTAWPNAVLWVPHHIGALVATLTGFLLLRDAERRGRRGRAALGALCGVAFASAAGVSVWVTLAFALFWALWIGVCLVRGWRAEAVVAVGAGVVALAVAAPFLVDLARANMLHEAPVALSVRGFGPVDRALDAAGAGELRRQVYRLAALPVNYLLELGFFAAAAAVYWRWRMRAPRPLGRGELGVLLMAGVGLVMASFVKSAIRANDLGWRSMMLVQFAAVVWAADVAPALAARARGAAPRVRPVVRRLLAAAMVVGAAGVAYDLAAMKLYPVGRAAAARLAGARPWSARGNGRHMHDVRAAYAWLNGSLPAAALVQPNPAYEGHALYFHLPIDVFQGLYGARAVVAGDPEYGTLYGIPRPMFDSVAAPIVAAFSTADAGAALAVCERHGLTALLVKDTDPVWRDPRSWAWRPGASFANASVRVVPCAVLASGGAGPLSGARR